MWLKSLFQKIFAYLMSFKKPSETGSKELLPSSSVELNKPKLESKPKESTDSTQIPLTEKKAIKLLYEQRCKELVLEAQKWLHVREKGTNRGKEVEEFQKAVDGKAQGEPWCLAFIQFCVKKVDERLGGETWLPKTEHCMTLWNKSPSDAKIKTIPPHKGSLIIWQYYKDGKATGSGHVGVIIEVLNSSTVITIEGNTGGGSEVNREGDGVYRKSRLLTNSKNMRVQGFLSCWNPEH